MAETITMQEIDLMKVARQFGEQVPHSLDLGMQVVAMDGGKVHMRMAPQPELLADDNAEDICTSVLYSLADSVCGLAVFAAIRELKPIATLDLRMDYLRPAASHRSLLATAHCHHLGDDIAFVYCEIRSEGEEEPVAMSNATFMRGTQGKHFQAANEQGGRT